MSETAPAPSLFFDFDNTITVGDVLDRVIEQYSPRDDWRRWEEDWQAGRITTAECLHRQMAGVRVSQDELESFLGCVAIDPAFPQVVAWATERGADLCILSDNFTPLILTILHAHRLPGIRVFANELVFAGDHLEARFPYRDPSCLRCAHCKASRVRAASGNPRIYVGDGLSDLCPSIAADVVFATGSLAAELRNRGVQYFAFTTLHDVLVYLQCRHGLSS